MACLSTWPCGQDFCEWRPTHGGLRSELLKLDDLGGPHVGEADVPLQLGRGETAVQHHRTRRRTRIVPHMTVVEDLLLEKVTDLIADALRERGQLPEERLAPVEHETEARRTPPTLHHFALLEIRLREAISTVGERLAIEAETEAGNTELERRAHR